jgi:hypothetical protein
VPWRPILIGLAGAAIALVMCFVVYVRISRTYRAGMDADQYGLLGLNLWRGLGLTFDPADGPTVYRGVFYPAFINAYYGAKAVNRLRADVEVGTCLSGGLDSTAVITPATRLARRGVHAFSSAYDEGPAFDERPHIRAAVEACGATSHLTVPDGHDFWAVFDAMALTQDEPTAGPGVYSQWQVMNLAHANGLKVLLDGQGGDEVCGGYTYYLGVRAAGLLRAGRPIAAAADVHDQVRRGSLGTGAAILGAGRGLLTDRLNERVRRLGRGRWGVRLSGELRKSGTLRRDHHAPGTLLARQIGRAHV